MPVLLFPSAFHIFEMVNAQFHELILFPDEQQVLLSCISQGIRHFKKKKVKSNMWSFLLYQPLVIKVVVKSSF